jgi:hypothetical protein
MVDAFVCTNLVNYTIARRGLLQPPARTSVVFYERWRFEPQPGPGIWHLPIGPLTMRLLNVLVALNQVGTLYVPHQRLNRRAMAATRRARSLAFLDDGLDARRIEPRNFDLPLRATGPGYFTFRDYAQLPPWLQVLPTQRVCQLQDLAAMSPHPAIDLDGVDHVLVESPGLDAAALIAALALPLERTLVVRHPVPHKRGALPDACRRIEGGQVNLEATLLRAQGKDFYFGETMALVFAAGCGVAARNRLHAQLARAQRDNLVGFTWVPSHAAPNLLHLAAAVDEPARVG